MSEHISNNFFFLRANTATLQPPQVTQFQLHEPLHLMLRMNAQAHDSNTYDCHGKILTPAVRLQTS
eukprot:14004387-Alexandrium_andersonii.AAC.1